MDENNLDSLLDELSSMDGELNENIDIDSGVDVDADDMDDISLDELDHLDGMDLGDLDFDDIDFDDVDITKLDAVLSLVRKEQIDVIVNCAAYTNVDKAEDDEKTADLINHVAVGYLAAVAKSVNATLIHISTDYVFRGINYVPFTEEDKSGECETRTATGRDVGAGGQYRCFWRSRLADAGRYRVARGRVR